MITRRTLHTKIASILLALIVTACSPLDTQVAQVPTPIPTVAPTSLPSPSSTSLPSATPVSSATPTPPATPTSSITPTPSVTLTPSATLVPVPPTATLVPLSITQRNKLFEDVWQQVRDTYVYTDYHGLDWQAIRAEYAPRVAAADSSAAFYTLLEEMIGRLGDDHSRFDSPQEVAADQERFDGKLRYVGIGAIIRAVPEGGMITQLARGGPAEQAGLQPRDVVTAVNGIPFTATASFGPGGPMNVVRGSPGTPVRLTIRSSGSNPRDVAVTRQPIPSDAFPSVQSQRLPGTKIALLTISTFYTADIDKRVRDELEHLLSEEPLDGLIIDVRDNGGGVIGLMLDTLGLFIDGGEDGQSKGRDGSHTLDIPTGKLLPQLANTKLVVLTSEDTVSAAEMFAAGLHDRGRARVVGTMSAGNTESLSPHQFSDGSRLWLAETIYIRPNGTPNEGHGITPDHIVPADWWRFSAIDDPQIRAAIQELSKQ